MIVGVLWVLGIPFLAGLTYVVGWWVVLFLVEAVWATSDYVRRPDVYPQIDHAPHAMS